jgi:hypothetical protein
MIDDFGFEDANNVAILSLGSNCIRQNFQILGPIFSMGMSLAFFLCHLLVIFHQKKNGLPRVQYREQA